MLPWKVRKHQILPVNQNLSSVYFSLAKFQLVSCNISLAMIWQITYTYKLPKLCSATLTGHNLLQNVCYFPSIDATPILLNSVWCVLGFSHDVTKIQTKKLSVLLSFYFHVILEHLKTFIQTNFRFKRVLCFAIQDA